MRSDRSKKQTAGSDAGVSEAIGAVLLVALVVAALGIVAISFLSPSTPSKVPSLKFMTGVNSSGTTLYLYHNGGDTLNVGEFTVLLDGVPASYTVSGGGSQWSLGKNLIVPISTIPQSVAIVYGSSGASGGVLLDQSSSDIVRSGDILPDHLPYLDCSAVKNWDCADQIPPEIISARYIVNVTTKRVTLMKYGQQDSIIPNSGATDLTYHLNFTVTDTPSSMTFGGSTCSAISLTKVDFATGDKVSVHFSSIPNAFTLYGAAPSIWEMTAGLASETYVDMSFANGTVVSSHTLPNYAICDTYIAEYSDFDSTLAIQTDATSKITSLTVNSTEYLVGVSNTSVIRLNNFRPTDNGLFLISFVASTGNAFYVIGWADSITIDGTTPSLGV